MVYGVVFPTPAKNSKGILVCTTTHGNTFIGPNANDMEDKDHGNTFIGPNANDMEDKEDTSVTAGGMDQIIASARKLIPNLPMGAAITEFAGLRAVSDTGDFIIGASEVEGLFNAAG